MASNANTNFLDIPSKGESKSRPKKLGGNQLALHRTCLEISAMDPWSVLESWHGTPGALFAWSDPESQVQFITRGRVTGLKCNTGNRFQRATQFCSELRELYSDGASLDDLPLLVGGFSFSEQKPTGDWEDWASAELWVPEEMIWTDGDKTFLVRNNLGFSSSPGEDLDYSNPFVAIDSPGKIDKPLSYASMAPTTTWKNAIQKALGDIRSGKLRKVVLARAVSLETNTGQVFNAIGSAHVLRNEHKGCTSFVIRCETSDTFLGASPETLLKRKGRHLESQALAGTAEHADTLKQSSKDREEQRMVVESILQQLEPFAELNEVSAEPKLRMLKDLVHLETRISALVSEETDTFSLLESLHPTPAVGGLPRKAALNWLADHEGLERGWYSGPVGWVNAKGDTHFVVAIRSVLMSPKKCTSFTGAGLVQGSEAQSEWLETEAKSKTVLQSCRIRNAGSRNDG